MYKNNKNINKKGSINSNNRNEDTNDEEKEGNNVQQKYGIGKLKISYCNSLSRLFIGETDEKSVREKYLMNITIKKQQKIKLNGVNMSKAESYTKNIVNEIKNKGIIIDLNLAKIIDKFNKEQKILEEYKKQLKMRNNFPNIKIIKNKNNNKNNSVVQVPNCNNKKYIKTSNSCFDYKTLVKFEDSKNSRNNKKVNLKKGGFCRNLNNSLLNNYINNNESKSIKYILKSPYSSVKKMPVHSERKIMNKRFAKFGCNNNNYFNKKTIPFINFMDRKDFFYNNEFNI